MGDCERDNCPDHTANMERIARGEVRDQMVEAQVNDLYDKHEETRKMLSDIKLCVERTNSEMKNGFSRVEEMIYSLKNAFDKRTLYADGLVEYFRRAVDVLDKRIVTVERTQWFFDKAEWFRNNSWIWIVVGIVGLVIFLFVSHWVETGIALRMKMGIKP